MKTRREVLKAAALTGLAAACGRGGGVGTVPDDDPQMRFEPTAASSFPPRWERTGLAEPARIADLPETMSFPLGVSSGDVSAEGIVVNCRYTGTAPLELRVWSNQRIIKLPVTAADYGFVNVLVTGLEPDTAHSYVFVELGTREQRSPIGRFRSALSQGDLKPLVFGATSCTSSDNDLIALKHASEREDLNAFFLLGDTTYCDGASNLQQFRDKWEGSIGRPLYRSLRASTPLVATWDDHEVDNDWNPELIGSGKLANARTAFLEHIPQRRDPMAPDRVWRSIRFGRTAEVFVLDSRSERKPSSIPSSSPLYISAEQLGWLKASLMASPCTFKVLLNSVPITSFPFSAFNLDSWNAYQAQRRDLLEFIDTNVTGALWLSGDHHFASVGRVSASGAGASQIEALAGPGAQGASPLWRGCTTSQWDYAGPDNNYLAVHLDPQSREARLVFWGVNGTRIQDHRYTL
ncbi:MAG: alkaline phosphatase D family protein [Myxococcaceae bacterium]|nr:alkaline phosphatase D family protein [Myxococcaceae bacterium]